MAALDGRYADWVLERWKKDGSDGAWEKVLRLLDDLEAAPLVPIEDVGRIVDGGHVTTLAAARHSALSPSQKQALIHLSNGLSYEQIGERMGCTAGTADTHVRRARIRLRAITNSHAIAIAISSGLIPLNERIVSEGRAMALFPGTRPGPMEARVLERVAKGDTNEEIAEWLDVSKEYVKDILSDLFELYGARNRVQLVTLAYGSGTLVFVSSKHKGSGNGNGA